MYFGQLSYLPAHMCNSESVIKFNNNNNNIAPVAPPGGGGNSNSRFFIRSVPLFRSLMLTPMALNWRPGGPSRVRITLRQLIPFGTLAIRI